MLVTITNTNMMRHGDPRFAWTRAEFADWAGQAFEPAGPIDESVGAPSQMAIFSLPGLESLL